jgi:cellulose synthase (UDP-forming)
MSWNFKTAFSQWLNDLTGRKEYHRYKEKELRLLRIWSQGFWLLAVLGALVYLGWCFRVANWKVWYVFVPFILAEIGFFIMLLLWGVLLWTKRHHRPEGVPAKTPFTVDVFVCVCGEPVEIVAQTIEAASKLDYDKKTVYVLDDGHSGEVRALAGKWGCTYLAREEHKFAKAGNLNFGFKNSRGDLVLTLDADQVAKPELIKRIVGYFDFKHIAYVQTSQRFSVPEDDPWGNSDLVFYKAMQSGKDSMNAAISCGSGVMYRRAALEDIGGFSEWNVVEDLHSSLKLHDRGWTSIYHDTSYTHGLAPRDIYTHIRQRWQWAVDSLRTIFFDSPFKHKGLNSFQKLQYFHFGYNYIAYGLCLPVFFILPIWSLFTGDFILMAPIWVFAAVRLPYLLAQMVSNKLLTDGAHTFKAFQAQAGLFGTYFNAFLTALCNPRSVPRYTVTSKKTREVPYGLRLRLLWPHLVLASGTVAAVLYGISHRGNTPALVVVNVVWCCWTLLVISRIVVLGLVPKLYGT